MESTAIQPIFDRDGYIALPVFFTPHRLAEITREVERFIASQAAYLPAELIYYEDPGRPETLTQAQHLQRYDEYFNDLLENEHLRLVAETVLKGPVAGMEMRYYNKPPGANKATPPHQDGAYYEISPCEAVELWLALDDAEEDTGCIWYVRGSHVLGLLPHQPTDVAGFGLGLADTSVCDDDRTKVSCRVRAGDLLVHHALTVHWTDPNESNHRQRRALGFVYYGHKAVAGMAQNAERERQPAGMDPAANQ